MTPKLAELIAWCRARIKVGTVVYNVPADTEEAALERGAQLALDRLRDPPPEIGTPRYAAWQARRNG